MSGHTPGPWPLDVHDQDEHGKTWRYVSFRGGPALLNGGLHGYPTDHALLERMLADARLIASAPDLLEACQRALEVIDAAAFAGTVELLRAAVEDATGEATP